MSTITRNTAGFSGLPATHPFATLDIGNRFKWSAYEEDFNWFDTTLLVGGYPYTHTNTNGTLAITTPTGVLTQTLTTTSDLSELQGTPAGFGVTSGKRAFFIARFNLTLASGGTISANEVFVGMSVIGTGTALINSGGTALGTTNSIGFIKYNGKTTMDANVRATSVESTNKALFSLASGTFVTVAFYFDGTQTRFWQGTAVDGSDMSFASPIATLAGIPAGGLVPTLFIKADEAKANVLQTDFLNFYVER